MTARRLTDIDKASIGRRRLFPALVPVLALPFFSRQAPIDCYIDNPHHQCLPFRVPDIDLPSSTSEKHYQ